MWATSVPHSAVRRGAGADTLHKGSRAWGLSMLPSMNAPIPQMEKLRFRKRSDWLGSFSLVWLTSSAKLPGLNQQVGLVFPELPQLLGHYTSITAWPTPSYTPWSAWSHAVLHTSSQVPDSVSPPISAGSSGCLATTLQGSPFRACFHSYESYVSMVMSLIVMIDCRYPQGCWGD